MHPGQGQGLSLRDLGEIGGAQSVALLVSEMPVHNHELNATTSPSTTTLPAANTSIGRSAGGAFYRNTSGPLTTMAPQALPPAGGSLPHNNLQPYLTLNYIIALQGVFPPR
jgi:microcystin-dependent protein